MYPNKFVQWSATVKFKQINSVLPLLHNHSRSCFFFSENFKLTDDKILNCIGGYGLLTREFHGNYLEFIDTHCFFLNLVNKMVTVVECKVNKGVIGKEFKKDAKTVTDYLMGLESDEVDALDKAIQASG